jgi:aminobenzoyl-glutamate utilization protein B
MKKLLYVLLACFFFQPGFAQQKFSKKKIEALKAEAAQLVQDNAKLSQEMVDMIFSFGELGFQEYETSKYITDILKKSGFSVEYGISGIETAWIAKWGSGSPVIAIGSDLDCIPKASQNPGVAYHDPMIEGAPGHGEGHNSGQALNVTAALAVKEIMEREGIQGTLVLWPGVAEELVASKAWFVRDGYFKDVDLCFFTHVSSNFGVSYGQARGTGLISVLYKFDGEAAHGAGSPWRGRSALDGVELMNVGWNFKREHLHPLQRSHYVIMDGGDQPNVVPSKASVWYYFREITYQGIKDNFKAGNQIAEGAALMTNTSMSYEILGSAWPRHFNKVMAETTYENIQKVGLPTWDDNDQTLAKALQKEVGSEEKGLAVELNELRGPQTNPVSGGSDDIGDVSWTVPTVTIRYPSNIPGLQGHHWSNAVAMATPIAHKGVTAGAKVEAMTLIDFLLKPELLTGAKEYFAEQTEDMKYEPLIGPDTPAPTYLNKEIMDVFRPEMEKYYYDPTKYNTYLEQLGITYPTIKTEE